MTKFLIFCLPVLLLLSVFMIPLADGERVRTMGSGKGTGNGQFDVPWGLGSNSTGHVFVAEFENHRVSVFDSSGNFQKFLINNGDGGSNPTDGQLSGPMDIEIDSSGNMWTLDVNSHRVQKFDKNGTYLLKIGGPSSGSGDSEFNSPKDLGLNSTDHVWIADTKNHRVSVFDSSGAFVKKFGTFGTGDGQFKFPQSLTMDSNDNVYVTDQNNRVQKFDSNGNYVSKFGGNGTSDGKFQNIHYIELDENNNIYVSDRDRNNVQVFSPNFEFKYQVSGDFSDPKDIDLDSSNQLNIAYDHAVDVYSSSTNEMANGVTSIDITSSYYELVFNSTNFNTLTTINIDNSNPYASLNFTKILNDDGSGVKSVTFPKDLTINVDISGLDFKIFFPSGTKLSGSSWDGFFKIFYPAESSDISVDGQDVNLAKKIGSAVTQLSLSKPSQLTIGSKAGQNAGYATNDGVDTITKTCTENSLSSVSDQLSSNDDCKIDSGDDLILWTNHFTTFFTSTSTSESQNNSGGHKTNCDSKGFGVGKSLHVYQVSYKIETSIVEVHAYSTCGSIIAKLSTTSGQKILGMSSEQPFLDDKIVVYEGTINRSDEKFTILFENERNSFEETFYSLDSDILRNYSLGSGYTSEQQGTSIEKPNNSKIPDWVKNNAEWWSENQVDDTTFTEGIGFLIKENIIELDDLAQDITENSEQNVPDWVKNNAGWWADGMILESDFLKGIKYMVENGIISLK